MKKQFIMLVMAGMLLVPMGNVFAQGTPTGSTMGYMFPQTQSVVVIGEDASKGTVLSDAEISGYSYIPWVVVDAQNLNLPIGYNFSDFFEYGCEGFNQKDLSVKIMIAPTYQEEGSTEFVTGVYMDVTSNPVLDEEGAYAYKIIVSKPGSDSPLSKIESGYIGVSSLVGSSVEATPVAEKATSSIESPAVAVESPSIEAPVVTESLGENNISTSGIDLLDGVGTSSNIEASVSSEGSMTTMIDPSMSEYYDIWSVQGQVKADYIQRCLDLINKERAKVGAPAVQLDQNLTKNAMIRAGECNIFYDHSRPGGGIEDMLTAYGSEILVMGGFTPEETVNSWMNSGSHRNILLSNNSRYLGIGQVNSSWACFFTDSTYSKNFKLADSAFISSLGTSSRVDNVVVAHEIMTPQFRAGSINATIDMGKTVQCKPQILTKGTWTVTSYIDVVPATVMWTSSNPKVASVDSYGLVTGLTSGQSTITGTLNGQSIVYTITVSNNGTPVVPPINKYLVRYRTHVQNVGWQPYVADGSMSGTSGRSLRLEGINIALDPSIGGGIEYRTHVQNIGWQGYVANDAMSGTSGMSYRLEAINIRLTGEAAQKYDIYYRVHTQNIGWMGWAKNDEASGSAGFGYRLEGIEVQLVLKGAPAPGSTANAFVQK